MWGRYGMDQLGLCILGASVALSLLGWVLSRLPGFPSVVLLLLNLLCYGLLGWYVFRVFSRNLDARRRENNAFLCLFRGLRDKDYRYYRCPGCRQLVRVPRGHGKIKISCPKCSEKFIRKS